MPNARWLRHRCDTSATQCATDVRPKICGPRSRMIEDRSIDQRSGVRSSAVIRWRRSRRSCRARCGRWRRGSCRHGFLVTLVGVDRWADRWRELDPDPMDRVMREDLCLDRVVDVRMLDQKLFCILAALTDPFAAVREPSAALVDDVRFRSEVDEISL